MFSVNPTLGLDGERHGAAVGARRMRAPWPPTAGAFQQTRAGPAGRGGLRAAAVSAGRVNGTPNLGLAVSDDGARDWRIGWRFDPAVKDDPGFEVNLDAMRRVAANDGTPQHGVLLTGAVRW